MTELKGLNAFIISLIISLLVLVGLGFSVKADDSEGALYNGTQYKTFTEAIEAANNNWETGNQADIVLTSKAEISTSIETKFNGTINLNGYAVRVSGSGNITVSSKDIKIIGNSGSIESTVAGVSALTINNGAQITISGGTYTAATISLDIVSKNNVGVITVKPGGRVIFNEGTIVGNSGYAFKILGVSPPDSEQKGGSVVIENGSISGAFAGAAVFGKGEFTLNGGTINGYYYGIVSNGSNPAHSKATVIINNGTITASNGTGLYLPSYDGITEINGSTTITGALSGIEMRGGSLTISGNPVIISEYEGFDYASNKSGTTTNGAAIAVSQHSTQDNLSLNIKGGSFKGTSSVALLALQEPVNSFAPGFNIAITDGVFDGPVYLVDNATIRNDGDGNTPVEHFISGGEFMPPVGAGSDEKNHNVSSTAFLSENIAAAVYSGDKGEANTRAEYFTRMEQAIAAVQKAGGIKKLVPVDDISDESGMPNDSGQTATTSLVIILNGGSLPAELAQLSLSQLPGTVNFYYIVPSNKLSVNLGTPTKAGYSFTGWSVNGSKLKGTTLAVDPETNETKVLEATWRYLETVSYPDQNIIESNDKPSLDDNPITPDEPGEPGISETYQPNNGFAWWIPARPAQSTTEEKEAVYRLYNLISKEYLYTRDENEVSHLSSLGDWRNEGIGWKTFESGKGVYRLHNPIIGTHLYTTDLNEVNTLSQKDWKIDNGGDPVFFSSGNYQIYRLYNPVTYHHLLTANTSEYHFLGTQGWIQEGPAFLADVA